MYFNWTYVSNCLQRGLHFILILYACKSSITLIQHSSRSVPKSGGTLTSHPWWQQSAALLDSSDTSSWRWARLPVPVAKCTTCTSLHPITLLLLHHLSVTCHITSHHHIHHLSITSLRLQTSCSSGQMYHMHFFAPHYTTTITLYNYCYAHTLPIQYSYVYVQYTLLHAICN